MMGTPRLVLASQNPHKARELEAILEGWTVEPFSGVLYPEEDGESFYENACMKARVVRALSDAELVAGEDSGLEVDALGGAPGIRSARFAGPAATDEENVRRLLEVLGGMTGEERRGRYVSELVCLTADGRELRGSGRLEGTVAEEPAGAEGFGYDPVFVPEGETRTVAELGDAWKAANSHRARAARALLAALGQRSRDP